MTKHNPRVDYLWELDPVHHGVNGCNVGQGQQIMVRLRNETNADFRSMEEIMDTMLHELAHNHYPAHGRHFYSFWNTLRGEYEALRTTGMLIKSRSRVSRSSGVDLSTEVCRPHRLFRFEAAGLGHLHRLAPRPLRMCEITYLLSRRQVPLLEDARTSLKEHSKLWPALTLNTFSHSWRKLEDSTLHLSHPTLAPTCMHRTQLFQTAAEHPHHDTIFRCVVRQYFVLA